MEQGSGLETFFLSMEDIGIDFLKGLKNGRDPVPQTYPQKLASNGYEIVEETSNISAKGFGALEYAFLTDDSEMVGVSSVCFGNGDYGQGYSMKQPSLNQIAVREGRRGEGLGSRLFEEQLDIAEELATDDSTHLVTKVTDSPTDYYRQIKREISESDDKRLYGSKAVIEEASSEAKLSERNSPMHSLVQSNGFRPVEDDSSNLFTTRYVKPV